MNVQPKLGDTLYPDEWAPSSTYLNPSDWDKAEWRVPSARYQDLPGLAIRLRVTGRTVQRKYGNLVVRVEITWVGDGEPDTHSKGYLAIDWDRAKDHTITGS